MQLPSVKKHRQSTRYEALLANKSGPRLTFYELHMKLILIRKIVFHY